MYKFSTPTIVVAPYLQHDMTWLFRIFGVTTAADYINVNIRG